MTQKTRQDQLFSGPVTMAGDVTQEGDVTQSGGVIRVGRELLIPASTGVVGDTAGWLVAGVGELNTALLPAAETASTLVVPISGLHVGDTVTGVRAIGQVESAGADVTLIMSFRKSTAAVADITDAEIGTDTLATVAADTLISGSALEVTALTEVLTELEMLYLLITGTTAALTDIALSAFVVTYDQA